MNARIISARVLSQVLHDKKFLDKALSEYQQEISDKREMRLAQELCYGVMRWYHQLDFVSALLLSKPLKQKDSDLQALILMGLYQLKYMRIPDHAAISATVETASQLGKPWARELINAVLRRYQREMDLVSHAIEKSIVATFSHPQWIIEKLQNQWPEYWQGMLTSNNTYPPLHLRIDLNKYSREDYARLLDEKGLEYITAKHVKSGICLVKPVAVEDIPGFLEGYISVQDFSAQLAASLLDSQSGTRVLDACAAPGGKTTHILEHTRDLQELVCVDISAERLKQLETSLERVDKNALIIEADISNTSAWWDGNQFDRILLDAPCSASGVIRRHPDIKYNRTEQQLLSLICNQSSLLKSVWPMLKTGGKLLFCTCSVFNEESNDQIAKFTSEYDNAKIDSINADWGVMTQYGRHTIPGLDEGDGFYYSIIKKT